MNKRSLVLPVSILTIAFIGLGVTISSAETALVPALVPMNDAKDETKLKKRKPVSCTSSKDIVLDRVLIESKGPAASLMGSCDITIKNSVIRTSGNALSLMGSGDIILINTTVESGKIALALVGSGDFKVTSSEVSGKTAVSINGSGDLVAKDSHFRGKKVVLGTGEYKDGGGNTWNKKSK